MINTLFGSCYMVIPIRNNKQKSPGRSTFYAHFETRDELPRTMCTDIFQHVFRQRLPRADPAHIPEQVAQYFMAVHHL